MKEKQRGDDHKLYCPTCKAGRNCMDHLMIRENDLQEQVTQLKADLATAKQGLEHYADTATWANWQPVRSGIIKAVRYSPNGTLQNKDPNGYDLAQQTLDKIGKE